MLMLMLMLKCDVVMLKCDDDHEWLMCESACPTCMFGSAVDCSQERKKNDDDDDEESIDLIWMSKDVSNE